MMNITHYDVAIIGGGVAGMTAAFIFKKELIYLVVYLKRIYQEE